MNKIAIILITLLAVTSGQNTTNSTTNSTVKTNTTTNSTVKTNTTTTATTASLYGSTCLGLNSLCAYNYACSSTCCSALTKRCVSLKSSQKNTMTSVCSVSPSWYPTQPVCSKTNILAKGSSSFLGVVIGIPCFCCIVCLVMCLACCQRKKKGENANQTQVV